MDMFCFVPVAVLVAAAGFIVAVNLKEPRIGASWFIAVAAALFVWSWTFSMHWWAEPLQLKERAEETGIIPGEGLNEPTQRQTLSEEEENSGNSGISVALDAISWPYMLALATLLLILLLIGPSVTEPKTAPRLWFFYLLIEAIGYTAVSSSGVRPLLYCWVIFDGIDFISRFRQADPDRKRGGELTSMAARLVGTLLAAASLALSTSDIALTGNYYISPTGGKYLLIACALRMGILPLSQPYSEMDRDHVGLGTMLRLVAILTVMPVLSRVPLALLARRTVITLSFIVGFAGLMGALGWVLSENASVGSSYAALAVASMAFACMLRSQQHAMIVWGISLVLTCAPLSLYRVHNRFMSVLAFLLILCFSGLPYTPNAVGWFGLAASPFTNMDLLFVVVPMLLIAGALIHVLHTQGQKFTDLEPWMRSIYPLGFIFAIGTHVFIAMTNWESAYSLGVIPASAAAFLGGVLIALTAVYFPKRGHSDSLLAWGREGVAAFWRSMKRLLDLDWLFSLIARCGKVFEISTQALSAVLEHSGGLVWEFLLMALLLSVIFTGEAL